MSKVNIVVKLNYINTITWTQYPTIKVLDKG